MGGIHIWFPVNNFRSLQSGVVKFCHVIRLCKERNPIDFGFKLMGLRQGHHDPYIYRSRSLWPIYRSKSRSLWPSVNNWFPDNTCIMRASLRPMITNLCHVILLWKGKNSIFWVNRSNVKVTMTGCLQLFS